MKLTSRLRRVALAAVTLAAVTAGVTADIHPASANTDCQPLVYQLEHEAVDCATWSAGHPATVLDADAAAGLDVNTTGWYPTTGAILEALKADVHVAKGTVDNALAAAVGGSEVTCPTGAVCAASGGSYGEQPSPSLVRIQSDCFSNDNTIHLRACYAFYGENGDSNPNFDYYMVFIKATSQGENGKYLERVKARDYNDGDNNEVNTGWAPTTTDQTTGNGTTISATAGGTFGSIGISYVAYPGVIHSYDADSVFHSSWEETNNGYAAPGQGVEVDASNEWRVPQGVECHFTAEEDVWYH